MRRRPFLIGSENLLSQSGGWEEAYPGSGSRTGQSAHAIGIDGPDSATQHTAIGSRGWLMGDGVISQLGLLVLIRPGRVFPPVKTRLVQSTDSPEAASSSVPPPRT